jgi:DNA-binding MarR family transcriptional regulator
VRLDQEDRRSRRVTLTADGRCLLAAAVPVWTRTHAETEGLLTRSSADTLRAALQDLC